MEIRTVKETREVVVDIIYIADDGKEFATLEACRQHDEWLKIVEDDSYIVNNAIASWGGSEDPIGAWMGLCEGMVLYLVVIDDRIVEWANHKLGIELYPFIGRKALFSGSEGWGWYSEGLFEDVVEQFESDLNRLKTAGGMEV